MNEMTLRCVLFVHSQEQEGGRQGWVRPEGGKEGCSGSVEGSSIFSSIPFWPGEDLPRGDPDNSEASGLLLLEILPPYSAGPEVKSWPSFVWENQILFVASRLSVL